MPTITATVYSNTSSTGDWDRHYWDSNTTWDTTDPIRQLHIRRTIRIPRKPTLDEILFDEDYKDKYEELELYVDWPDNVQDWKDTNRWTTKTQYQKSG